MVAFFMTSGVGCPTGWAPYAPAAGRLLLPVSDPTAVGVTLGNALADQAAPVHTHTFSTTVSIPQKELEAHTAGSNRDGARSDETPNVPNNPPGTTNNDVGESSNLPFIQLFVCKKQ